VKAPIPKPEEKKRKGRGGKNQKALKDKLRMTEMRKMMNTVKFGIDA
jgi:hypothetical protein